MDVYQEETVKLKKKYPSPNIHNIKKICDDLTAEEQRLIQMVKTETTKAKSITMI